jgi:RNA polymerase sigma factor (sigma-70 family)
MPDSPQTRSSLVVRLYDARDEAAWAEFLVIYEPLILRLLCKKGLQECDARDICQQVLAAVARDIEQWRPDGAAASFRRWLFQIARNRAMKFLSRSPLAGGGVGGSAAYEILQAQPAARTGPDDEFDLEYRQQLLFVAAGQIRAEFREATWAAFWQTCVADRPVTEVALELGMTVGNVYVARSRVIGRLRVRVGEMLSEM